MNKIAMLIRNLRSLNRRDMMVMFNVLSPTLIVLFLGVYFHEFVLHAISANIIVNLGIIGAATIGVVTIIVRLVDAQKDFYAIQRFGTEASQGADRRALLQEPWINRRYVRHYLSHIANTGGTLSHLEYSSIESELHALQADYDSRLEMPQFIVGFMIALGLLGTFIGLLETLTGISTMLDSMGGSEDVQKQFMKLLVELRRPLAGMGLAFSASMFGLVTSLMLGIMMTNLRRYVSRVISLSRNVMHELTGMNRKQAGVDLVNVAMAPATSPSRAPRGSDVRDSTAFVGSMELFTKKIELLVTAFNSHNESTRKLNDLLGVGPRMKETNEKSLDILKAIEKSGEKQNLMEMDLMNFFAEQSATQKQLFAKQQQSMQELITVNGDIGRAIFSMLDMHKTSRADEKKEVKSLIDSSEEMTHIMNNVLEAQKQSRTEMATLLRTQTEKLGEMRDIEISGARHLNEIKEGVSKFADTLSMVELVVSGISGQTTVLNTLVDEVRVSQDDMREFLDRTVKIEAA